MHALTYGLGYGRRLAQIVRVTDMFGRALSLPVTVRNSHLDRSAPDRRRSQVHPSNGASPKIVSFCAVGAWKAPRRGRSLIDRQIRCCCLKAGAAVLNSQYIARNCRSQCSVCRSQFLNPAQTCPPAEVSLIFRRRMDLDTNTSTSKCTLDPASFPIRANAGSVRRD